MKSILRATAVLSGASVVSIVMGLISAKISAVLLGPSGVGYMGLLQGLLGLTVMIASVGVGAGLVRSGAQPIARKDLTYEAELRAGAWALYLIFGCLAVLAMMLLRRPLARIMLGGAEHEGAVAVVAVGALLMIAATLLTSILNAHHRVTELARLGMLNSFLGIAFSVLIIWKWRAAGIVWAVLAGCVVNWVIALYYVWRRARRPRISVQLRATVASARSLLRFGGPYTASMLVGTGVLLALPALILHALGTDEVGFYRAAAAVSVNYLGFLLVAMAQDYYPRVSAVHDQPEVLRRLINDQHRLIMLLGVPIILGMLALVPYLIPLIYSRKFAPAAALLEWQLIGDIFKFAAWTMSFVILARSGSLVFFCIELIGGSTLLLLSWWGMRWFGLEGLGMAFVVGTFIYYLVCLAILKRDIQLRWTGSNILMFLAATLAASIVRVLPYIGLERFRTPVALALALLAGAWSLYSIWHEVGGLRGLLERRVAVGST
ncbi:MAG TPA: oligosaccharide flippase family protein [Blastocatellia bacterium]|nr:oligosaccharide flippase family protein [Blastocatellia bacterium]